MILTIHARISVWQITGLPYSERKLTKVGNYTVKVAGADRKEKWWSDVILGRRYLEIVYEDGKNNEPTEQIEANQLNETA